MRGTMSDFMVTLDGELNVLHSTHKKRKICYVREGQGISENWVVHENHFFELFMIIGALTGRGTLPLIKESPQNSKLVDINTLALSVEWL